MKNHESENRVGFICDSRVRTGLKGFRYRCAGFAPCGFHNLAFLIVAALAAVVLSGVRVAAAESFDEAQVAYRDGRFVEAAEMGEAVGTSESYTLAAKSLTIHGQYISADEEKKALFERAIELADNAVRLNPENSAAYLELTRALGQHSFQISKLQAIKDSYAGKTRQAIENAIRVDPNSASAHINLGRWHVGIIARTGSIIARATYGARKKDVVASFARAIELDPRSKEDLYSMAIGYEALSYKKYRNQVHELLKRAIEMPVADAYDRIMHDKAVKHLESLE